MLIKIVILSTVLVASCQSTKDRKPGAQSTSSSGEKARSSGNSSSTDEIKSDRSYSDFWLNRKELSQKLEEAIKAANKDQENPVPYVKVAELAHLLDRIVLGRKACKKSLKNRPGYQAALLACAKIELADENFDLAALTLDKLTKKNQKKAVVKEMKALIAIKKGEFNEASILYADAALSAPRNVRIQLNAGLMFVKYNQSKKAEGYFRSALKIDNDHPVALFHLAIIEIANNEFKKAEEKLLEVADDANLGDFANIHLARIYEQRGEFLKATNRLKKLRRQKYAETYQSQVSGINRRLALFMGLERELKTRISAKEDYLEWKDKQTKAKKAAKPKDKADGKK